MQVHGVRTNVKVHSEQASDKQASECKEVHSEEGSVKKGTTSGVDEPSTPLT